MPPSGQSWTTLAQMQSCYKNEIKQDDTDGRIWSIFSSPQFAIGQRAVFIETEAGNVLWDCISLLDSDTIDFIKSRGGLKAIAISHPHFYSTHLEWAREFDCPVYLAEEDQEWINRDDEGGRRQFVTGPSLEILPGVNVVKLGGHFPGSSALHWNKNLVSRKNRTAFDPFRLMPFHLGLFSSNPNLVRPIVPNANTMLLVCRRLHWNFSGRLTCSQLADHR